MEDKSWKNAPPEWVTLFIHLLNKTYNPTDGLDIDSLHYLHQYSNHECVVAQYKEYIICSFRGTARCYDYLSDMLLFLGIFIPFSYRLQRSRDLVRTLRKIYPEAYILCIGHSLGGTIAEFSHGDYCITYNKGVGLGGIGNIIPKHQLDIRTEGDCVSILANTQFHFHDNLWVLPKNKKNKNRHNLKNLSILKRSKTSSSLNNFNQID